MLGKWFSASDALKMGLVNRVVDKHELMQTALNIADEVLRLKLLLFL